MSSLYLTLRSLVLWPLSLIHFGIGVPLLVLLTAMLGHRRMDPVLRFGSRNVVRLAGARLRCVQAPRFDPNRTSIFVANHVNIFDPFVVNASIPQSLRGLELASHFKVPIYGLLIRYFGNVPLGDERSPADVRRAFRMVKNSLDRGISMMVFAEGSRTRTGRVGPFQEGVFAMARQFKYPIVPVSIVGAFNWKRLDDWRLRPACVTVILHDTIETVGMSKADLPALRERVWQTVAEPVHAALNTDESADSTSSATDPDNQSSVTQ